MIAALRRYSRRHPRTVAAVICCAFAAALLAPLLYQGVSDVLAGSGVLSVNQMIFAMMWQLAFCLILTGCVAVLGWHDIAGFQGPIDRGGMRSFYLVMSVPMFILTILLVGMMGDGSTPSPLRVIMIILSLNALVGLSEEVLFRGIVFGALRQKHRLITAIVVSSAVFGLLHLANLGSGQPLATTMYQVVNAALLGGLFCALLLQTNSIWPPIVLHMVWNSYVMVGFYTAERLDPFASQVSVDDTGFSANLFVLPVILVGVTWLILWRYQRRTGHRLWDMHPTPRPIST